VPSPLIIPGVQVKTVFEPSPALPSRTGILGVVGVTDRGPLIPTPVGSMGEFIDIFGPASRYSMPEVRSAFANGVSQMVISRTLPSRGQKASLDLLDDEGEKVASLIARAEGQWANHVSVRATQVKTLGGKGIKYVNLEVTLDGQPVETFNNLVLDEDSPDYFFDRINNQSRVIVAEDPTFQAALPAAISKTALTDAGSRAAFVLLKSGNADVIRVDALRNGDRGNASAIRVRNGQAGLSLPGAALAPGVDIRARQAGNDGTAIRVSVVPSGSAVQIVVTAPPASARTYGPFATVDEIVAGLKNDPDVVAVAQGTTIPAPQASTPLARRVDIDVVTEGVDSAVYANLASNASIAAIDDPNVKFSIVNAATQLPDANLGLGLQTGRDPGPALLLNPDTGNDALLELVPLDPAANVSIAVTRGVSTLDHATAVANLAIFVDDAQLETLLNLTMDPDDPQYLPAVLAGSTLVRAHSLMVRSRTTSFPASMTRAKALTGGTSPLADDYQDALDRLESAEEVDLVIGSVLNQLDQAGVRSVHKLVVAHCTKMADVARNRIGLGSATVAEAASVPLILDHADDVRSDYFILSTPSGSEGPMAGLLARQDYFQSPTFKTIAALDGNAGTYTDSQLGGLVTGNVVAINVKRSLGVVVIKGLLTSGRQINVQRTANKSVRDVKAICDKYIGLLNNDGARNSLRQQIIALFLQMERDGAIVPSTDGKDPSYKVDVYSTQADFANGIVRVDIAVRPVRAIDYIYATILVKN
jgi:hypothetical protein